MKAFIRVLCLLTLALPIACGGDADPGNERAADESTDAAEPAGTAGPGVTVEGFSVPESVLHDAGADVYLVSNIDGDPAAKDGNGFISRVAPDGEILELRWIDGAAGAAELHAPKGMALLGDTLFVADIDVVRLFHRVSGATLGAWPVDGATFLNDVAASDGRIYASDTGVRFADDGTFEDAGTTAVHVFTPDGARTTLDTGDLTGINGITASDGIVYGVTFGTGTIFAVEDEVLTELPELPGLGLDGIVAVADGLLVSDWDNGAVYLLRDNGSVSVVVRNLESPGDIGIDRTRNRLLIPSLSTGRLLLAPLGS